MDNKSCSWLALGQWRNLHTEFTYIQLLKRSFLIQELEVQLSLQKEYSRCLQHTWRPQKVQKCLKLVCFRNTSKRLVFFSNVALGVRVSGCFAKQFTVVFKIPAVSFLALWEQFISINPLRLLWWMGTAMFEWRYIVLFKTKGRIFITEDRECILRAMNWMLFCK